MKFSEITEQSWEELKPYLDTCLLPVTGLTGLESPNEAGQQLEKLRDWLDLAEIPFQGRLVTYPAYHFVNDDDKDLEWNRLERIALQLKQSGFHYVILMSAAYDLSIPEESAVDLVLTPYQNELSEALSQGLYVRKKIEELWHRSQIGHQL